ncbi:putative ribonuclease H-like domain-containing protein [Tanacetum coccineum]
MVTGNNYNRVDYDYYAKTSHPSTHRSMPPRVVLLKSGLTPVNTTRPIYSAHPKPTVHYARPMIHFSKKAQSTVQRPFYKKTTLTNKYFNQKVNTIRPRVVNTARPYTAPVNTVRGYGVNAVKTLACWVWRPTRPNGKPPINDKGFVDSGCSRHMIGNIAHLSDFQEFDGGYVTFRGGAYGGRITGKGTLKTDNIDFKDVYFVNELKFNLFSVSQMCDKKNYVLFTDSECLVSSPDFILPDESQILLKILRKDNMYSFDMKSIVPKDGLTYLVAKATLDESMLWHRRLGHINFKNINKLIKDNLVRGFPLKRFENDQTCVACLKGKQQKASCKSTVLNPITKPLFMLHIDLFGPTFDETSEILKNFIKEIENLVDMKVKIIRIDNGIEFKNKNGVAKRRNRTLVEAARTMLTNSKLLTTFWAKAVSTACYVENKVLVVKPHNKTPYELFKGFKPALSFMRPFGCHVTILNTLDNLGKFDGKSVEGFFVGYSLSSKAYRVYNTRTRKVEENLHIGFLEDKPMVEGNGRKWLFDIDSLTQSMNYVPVAAGNDGTSQDGIVMPIWKYASHFDTPFINVSHDEPESSSAPEKRNAEKRNAEIRNDEKRDDEGISKTTSNADLFGDDTKLDMSNLNVSYQVPTTPTTRIHKDHSLNQVIGDIQSGVQTRGMTKTADEQALLSAAYERKPHEDLNTCRSNARSASAKDERDIVIRNKARLVAQGHTQEEGIDYDEVFSPVARIEAIRLFLAYASFMGFIVYQMDVNSAFLYGKIEEEVYVCQPPGFEDPDYPDKVYKVVKSMYGLHQAPRAWYETLANYLVGNGFQRGKIDQTLFIKKKKGDILLKDDGIFISQDKYVPEILRKFNYTDVKSASITIDLEKPLVKDGDADDVDCKKVNEGSNPSTTEVECVVAASCCGQAFLQKVLMLEGFSTWSQVGDEAVHKELGDRMERAATTASSLEAEQDSGNIKCQDTILGGANAQTRFAIASIQSNNPPLSRGHTLRSREDREKETSTAQVPVSTVSPEVTEMSVDEELSKKIQKEEQARAMAEQEQERINFEVALEYHALKNKPVSVAQARKNMITYLINQGGYKQSYFKKMSYEDIRLIFEKVCDQVNTFIPKDSEFEKEVMKRFGFSLQQKEEKIKSEQVEQVEIEKKLDEEEAIDYEKEKEELRMWLTVVPDEEEFVDPKILHAKFPIVDWESQSLGSMHVYKIIRANGNTSYHKKFKSMLKSFDRQDLMVLDRLVMERFEDNTPEGYNLMLWGDMKILVDLKEDDDIWKNQHEWKIISWKLYETCGVHTLMVDDTLMTIHMFVEKKYPLTKETLQKMLL